MTTAIGLESVVSHFPDTVMTPEDFAYLAPITPPELAGSNDVRRATGDDAVETMGVTVARKALDAAGLEPGDIDLIISQNFGGKFIVPMIGTSVHQALGCPAETNVMNLQTCCASMVDGFHVAWNLIKSGAYKRVLVLCVTALDDGGWGADPTSAQASGVGDGAGAAIVSAENLKCEFLSYDNKIYGELYESMRIDFEPMDHPELMGNKKTDVVAGFHIDTEILMAWINKMGPGFARDAVEVALKKAGLDFSDLDYVVPHQVISSMMEMWKDGMEEVGIKRENWLETFDKYGNIGAVDVAANLVDAEENGGIPAGSVLAFFTPGGGGHTPAMVVRWNG